MLGSHEFPVTSPFQRVVARSGENLFELKAFQWKQCRVQERIFFVFCDKKAFMSLNCAEPLKRMWETIKYKLSF